MTTLDDEWDRRILCSDGNCIGIVGTDGRCNMCGKPYDGELPLPAGDSATFADDAGVDAADADQEAQEATLSIDEEAASDIPPGDDDWENRTLCIDERCIGVVGPDGRCKVCGKPYPR